MTQKKMIRIGNAGGYWGDDPYALRRQVQGNLELNYISIDYLAEITMSILQKQFQKDPSAGYARDFITQLDPLLPEILDKKIKIITNAGGVNPHGCAKALMQLAQKKGYPLKVAVVEGDNIVTSIKDLVQKNLPFKNMDTGEHIQNILDKIVAANIYFGAQPVVEALKADPDIVICGRVTDTGITLGAMMHEFKWKADEYDKIAHGIVAGHIIECGAQSTGGNFTDWKKVPSFTEMGFPIVECYDDGSFIVTKHDKAGGLVSCQTVREQLVYEMGDPKSYIVPDVIADFSTIQLEQSAPNRVKVFGIKGRPPTDLLKVSIAFEDGWKSVGTLIISGPDARLKAEVFSKILWEKLESELRKQNLKMVEACRTEYIGHDSCHALMTPRITPTEILLRLNVRDYNKEKLNIFRKLIPSLILSGPSGVAVTGGAPLISEVISYWPALMPQEYASASVTLFEQSKAQSSFAEKKIADGIQSPVTKGIAEPTPSSKPASSVKSSEKTRAVPLIHIAHARSGDKGDTANIGIIGRSPECYAWLQQHITAEKVKDWFKNICDGTVNRYDVPNLWALNFLLEESLDGGGTMSLKIDAQGKTYSQALLRCVVDVPESLLKTIPTEYASCSEEYPT